MEKLILRSDILKNIFININLNETEIYSKILNATNSDSEKGFLFETLCELLIISKCIDGINYDEIKAGEYPSLNSLKDIKEVFKKKIRSKEGGVSDILIEKDGYMVSFSIKYKNTFLPSSSDVTHIDSTFKKEKYKIGLIVKDKNLVVNHKYTNNKSVHKIVHDKVILDKLLFDEGDVIKGIKVFIDKFKKYKNNIEGFYERININYLNSGRKQLVLKLHQKLAFLKFVKNVKNSELKHIISHKPRSGKSILMLLMSLFLLENKYKRILIMTAIPDTISDFVSALDTYIDFKDIKYKIQKEDDFNFIEENFSGIIFASLQYFKTDANKKIDLLKKLNFDVIFNDECHIGGTTIKTQRNILDINQDDILVDNINKNFKLNIFASGTSDKAKKHYKVKPSCIYEWEIEDEAYMKELKKDTDIENIMSFRHGSMFKECLNDISLNKDYSNCPTQVLMKSLLPQNIINKIIEYNTKNNTDYGFSFSSLFALKQVNNKHKYEEQFEICSSLDGIEMLISILDNIISDDKNKLTIMKQVEKTQYKYKSRISTRENPLLTIIFLPTNTRNNTIDGLQKTLKKFLEKNKLWGDYNIEYSNSVEDTGDIKQKYNDFIKSIMKKTKEDKKKGCILFLGNKGGTGITYHDCDISISLDDGHNIDNQKQKYSRVLTEAPDKTIGINIDMNIQRTYMFLLDKISNFRKITKKDMTNDEILYYLFSNNIFLFDPLHYDNNNFKVDEIKSYYKNEIKNMMKEIDDTLLLENIICNDDLKDIIKTDWKNLSIKNINPVLEGEQKNCPKPSTTHVEIDHSEKDKIKTDIEENITDEDEDEVKEELINQTFEMCKSFMFPLLSILSREYNIINFKDIFENGICRDIILKICQEKKIDLNNINYNKIKNIMSEIIDMNDDIVISIREIYRIATPSNLRSLIEKHFIPSKDEKKKNAEIPTPVKLVDDMLSKIPSNYWNNIHTTFEPCCGKGNFVIGIFDMFFIGLENKIPNKIKRCKAIMTKCIYFADLTTLNVFITTEILKCHIEDKCGVKVDYEFNSNIGNTLNLDIEDKWGLKGIDSVIGNPPYEEISEETGESKGGTNQYTKFINYNINKLNDKGYLLFINPISWIGPSTNKQSGNDLLHNVFLKYDLLYLNLNECKKYFKEGSTFCFYLLNKNISECMTNVISKHKNEISISKINFKNYKEMKFLPIHITEETIDLVKNVMSNKNKLKICRSRKLDTSTKFGKEHLSLVKNEKFKYITYHTTSKTFYSDIKLENFNNSKILLNMSGHLNPIIVDNCNITESKFYIELEKDEDKKIINIFKNNNIKKYLELCKYSGFNSRIVLENISYNLDELDFEPNLNSLIKEVKPSMEVKIDDIDSKKYTCECGNTLNKTGKLKHEQSSKHKNFIENQENRTIKEPKNVISEISYNKYNVVELKNLAKEKGIKGYSKLKKQELVDLLKKV